MKDILICVALVVAIVMAVNGMQRQEIIDRCDKPTQAECFHAADAATVEKAQADKAAAEAKAKQRASEKAALLSKPAEQLTPDEKIDKIGLQAQPYLVFPLAFALPMILVGLYNNIRHRGR